MRKSIILAMAAYVISLVHAQTVATLDYYGMMKVVALGGQVCTSPKGIDVTGADEVTVYVTVNTDYSPTAPGYKEHTDSFADEAYRQLTDVSRHGWSTLLSKHTADYRALFDRMSLHIDGAVNNMPTDQLVNAYTTSASPAEKRMLELLYFQYGRYMLIASSRRIDLPNNLQGIWNHSNTPDWQCDMHANINVQMNYWLAEVTNLSELHEKYVNYIYNMAIVQPQWQSYARRRCG